MFKISNSSKWILIILMGLFLFFRFTHISSKEISWDVFGYYLPLPATFIYDDPMLNNVDWVKDLNDKHHFTGTLYMISSNDKGESMYFFLLGMSIVYLPFFLIGHFAAWIFGFPMDGFSIPYVYSLVFGSAIYTLIGMLF